MKKDQPHKEPLKLFTWKERLQVFDVISNSLNSYLNGQKLCVSSNKLGNAVKMSHRFGSPSKYGEAWIGYVFNDGTKIAVKKVVLLPGDRGESFTKKQLSSGESAWIEMAALQFASMLVIAKICPNLPLTYKYFWCPKCKFENKEIEGSPIQPCLYVANELANGDLHTYVTKKTEIFTPAVIENCVFQLVAACYAFEKYYLMTHNDLHLKNVLVHEIQPGGYWEYRINGKTYRVPNLGYVFVVWDFGMVHIPGKIKGFPDFFTMEANPVPNETDIGRVCSLLNDKLRSKTGIRKLGRKNARSRLLSEIERYEGRMTLKEILNEYFRPYTIGKPQGQLIDAFNMDIPLKQLRAAHPDFLKQFVRE